MIALAAWAAAAKKMVDTVGSLVRDQEYNILFLQKVAGNKTVGSYGEM